MDASRVVPRSKGKPKKRLMTREGAEAMDGGRGVSEVIEKGNEGRVVGGKGGSGREAITSSLVRRETSSSSRRLSAYIYI